MDAREYGSIDPEDLVDTERSTSFKKTLIAMGSSALVLSAMVALVVLLRSPVPATFDAHTKLSAQAVHTQAVATSAAGATSEMIPKPIQLTGPKINVAVYYEALCDFCQQFITKILKEAYHAYGVSHIMDVSFIPFGNGDSVLLSDESYNFTCQHGPHECRSNMWQACAVATVQDPDKLMDYIVCLERAKDPVAVEERCAKSEKVDYDALRTCFQTKGNALLREMQVRTAKLEPPLRGVPHVTVDGDVLQDTSTLLDTVCKRYKGAKPLGCLFVEEKTLAVVP